MYANRLINFFYRVFSFYCAVRIAMLRMKYIIYILVKFISTFYLLRSLMVAAHFHLSV